MADPAPRSPWLPPRAVVRGAWLLHRFYHRATGGRRGLRLPKDRTWGTLVLTTVGRKTGQRREAILGYYEDGTNLVTLAMNGWAEAEPAWWLNLQAQPDATVELKTGERAIHARTAEGDERTRLWTEYFGDEASGYATRRPKGTAVVVLEPRADQSSAPSREPPSR